ncbi:MAG: hybrid sensor histidine kinase/response regulator [Planctomycetota bacterium]
MEYSQAEVVLSGLAEAYALDDVQAIVDRVCERVVRISPYRLAILSLYFDADVYIGVAGGDEALRRRFYENARKTSLEGRAAKRTAIWEKHRVHGTSICFIPEGSEIPLSAAFVPSPTRNGSEWKPEDRLMVFVRGVDGEVRGVLSLDRPEDGRRPDPADLGPLATIDRFMTLMGAVIHNKHLAAKLRESEERYAAVVEQGHDGILIVRNGEILFANRRLGDMLGAPPASLAGKPLDEVLLVDDEWSLPGERECRLRRPDGQFLHVTWKSGTIRLGGATATLVAVADVSERRRILSQLLRAQKLESVGTLASGIAHDFNNLLGAITGYASLLLTRLTEQDPLRRYVQSIEKAADRAAAVTRQLLGVVRNEQVRVKDVKVQTLLEDLHRLLEASFDPSISIVLRCPAALPPVVADEAQIHQVLLNVCLNSRDAMPRGGMLTLEAGRVSPASPGRAGGDFVRISVTDTGCGIDRETLAKVFDPFFTTKEAGKGTGLGLYMAYRIVERHGGTIDISSTPGAGTKVEIFLPEGTDRATLRVEPPAAATKAGGERVLVVDDEELLRNVASEMLQALGYDPVAVSGGREALEVVKRDLGSISCVILDLAMPGMDGWESARLLRAAAPHLPIVISSGHDPSAQTRQDRTLETPFLLKKPYRMAEMREIVGAALRARVS